MKSCFTITFMLFLLSISLVGQTFSFSGWSQIGSPQFRGRTFSKDAYTFTKLSSGVTMSAKLSSSAGLFRIEI
jgi:hypothetical protein